jgi:predicted RND superfamily exporter protein
MLALVAAAVAVYGITQVSLDSRFIEYFRSGTEIRDGMAFIDRTLGGTIPMDIVVKFPPFEPAVAAVGGVDEFDDFADNGTDPFPSRYWFTPQKLRVLERLSAYLDARPEVGKSVSLTNLEQIARDFNDGEPLDQLQLVAVLSVLPEDIRQNLIDPYASPESGEFRIATRVHETGPSFSRQALIDDIIQFATDELHLDEDAVRVTGVAVLFNNMIKQLFDSQRSTLLFVVAATFIMFFLLLRSLRLAIIGLLPNLLAAAAILAVMGYVGVSLDMMTIMIAAIVIGIGVDDAIHYLHRFREEVARGHDVRTAVRNSHRSIGSALYFTTLTIVIGLSVLGLSNFIPTISFGLFTGIAMLLALLANLTVLPSLLVKFYK